MCSWKCLWYSPIIVLCFISTKNQNKYMFLSNCYFRDIFVYVPMFLTCSYLYSLLKLLCILYSLWSKSNACSLFVETDTFCALDLSVIPLCSWNKVWKPQPNIVEDWVAIRRERLIFITLFFNPSEQNYIQNTIEYQNIFQHSEIIIIKVEIILACV